MAIARATPRTGAFVFGAALACCACGGGSSTGASGGASGNGASAGGGLARGGTSGASAGSANAGVTSGGSSSAASGGVAGNLVGGSGGDSSNAGASAGGAGGIGGVGGVGGAATKTLAPDSLAVRFANAVLQRWPDPATVAGSPSGWDYNHGIVLRGIEQVYRYTGDARYLAYIEKYVDEFVQADGSIPSIPAAHSFDNLEPAVLLPFLFQQTMSAKYQAAALGIRNRYDSIPTNADGGFWHKQTYPNQMWLDSIYMGEPFLARYGAVFGTCGTYCASTVVTQSLLIAAHVEDSATGLLYHAWDDSPAGQKAAWADPTTGRSPVIWSRALGWYAMSLVDVLDDLPLDTPNRASLLALLPPLAQGLKSTQDPSTGLWHQVVDKGTDTNDWIEESGSGMFVYALKVAVERGYIDASYGSVAQAGMQGLQQNEVTTDTGGLPTINGAVQGMSVQTTYAGYLAQARVSNSPHGLCSILLAAAEMEAE